MLEAVMKAFKEQNRIPLADALLLCLSLSANAFIVPVMGRPKNLVDAGMELSIGDLQCVPLFLRYLCHCKCDGFADFRNLLQWG